jgi:transcriptional regulator
MYDLPYHKENDQEVVRDFIKKYPFAFLSGCDGENKPIATQIPVFIEKQDGKEYLRGHLMKDTDHHRAFLHNENVLVVFTGHHTYVSGTWYSNPHIPSTWNYMSVHIKGRMRFLNEAALENVLRKTSLHFEQNNPNSTTVFDNIPTELKQRIMHLIVPFEIEVVEIDTVFKLSQDRDAESYRNIIEKLKQQGESGQVIATEMEKRTTRLFPENNQS